MNSLNGNVAIALIENEEEYLMVQRSENVSYSGKWVFPGGKILENEQPREAALREVKEETKLRIKILESGKPYFNKTKNGKWKIFPFKAKSNSRKVVLNSESKDYTWMKPEKLLQLESLGSFKAMERFGLT